jgi:tetratricopeptide (TPR) repeat protein
MSPEQAAGCADQCGPASDVYSLGAILYTILVGHPPVAEAAAGDMQQAVITGKIAKPTALAAGVPRPLEAICLKAMSQNPSRRYAAAGELAGDVEAWLADEPVAAWPEPRYVRAVRWMRRHRTLVATTAATLVLAVVGLSLGIWLLAYANRQVRVSRDVAQSREKEATENFQLARSAVDRYLTRVAQDPRLRTSGLEPLRRSLLETAREFYAQFAAKKPNREDLKTEHIAALMRLAEIEAAIGSKPKALGILDDARAMLATAPADPREAAKRRRLMAQCLTNLGLLHLECKHHQRAATLFAEAMKVVQESAASEPLVVEHQLNLASLHQNQAKLAAEQEHLDEADACCRAAIAVYQRLVERTPKTDDFQAELAAAQTNLALLCRARSRDHEALALLGKARKTQEQLVRRRPTVPRYQSDLAVTCCDLAVVHADAQRFVEAEEAYKAAIAVGEKLAEEHAYVVEYQSNVARGYNGLATLLCRNRRWKPAEEALRAASSIHRRLADAYPDDPQHRDELASTLTNLGILCCETARPQDAETAFREAVEVRRPLAAKYSDQAAYQRNLATTYDNLGTLYGQTERLDEAEVAFKAAAKLRDRLAASNPPTREGVTQQAVTHANLGRLALKRGQPHVAKESCENTIAILARHARLVENDSDAHRALQLACLGLAESLGQLGEHRNAAKQWEMALTLDDGEQHDFLLSGHAEALARCGDHRRAAREVKQLQAPSQDQPAALYHLAVVLAIAADAAAKELSASDAVRRRTADDYARRALELLRQAQANDFFRDAAARKDLLGNPDLKSLRQRSDFAAWIDKL